MTVSEMAVSIYKYISKALFFQLNWWSFARALFLSVRIQPAALYGPNDNISDTFPAYSALEGLVKNQ